MKQAVRQKKRFVSSIPIRDLRDREQVILRRLCEKVPNKFQKIVPFHETFSEIL